MKRFVSACVGITLAAGLLSAAPTASAAGECPDRRHPISDAYAPSADVVLGPGESVEITVGMSGWSGCFEEYPPSLHVFTPARSFPVALTATTDQVGYTHLDATLRLDAAELANTDTGEWVLEFGAGDSGGEARALNVKRDTRLSFDAGPEPLRRHHRLTFRGRLRAADWECGTYRGLRDQEVRVYALDGQTPPTWEPTAVLRTKRHGRYKTRTRVEGPNRFQASFTGTYGLDQAGSRIDEVAARR